MLLFLLPLLMVADTPSREVPISHALPETLDLSQWRRMVVQHDGRWCPLDTMARDIVQKVTGTMYPQQHDPDLWLLAWTLDPDYWKKQPLISIQDESLREELGLSDSDATLSYDFLFHLDRLFELMNELAHMPPKQKPTAVQSAARDVHERLNVLSGILQGSAIHIIPAKDESVPVWRSVDFMLHSNLAELDPIQAHWHALRRAYHADDATAFLAASTGLRTALNQLPASHRPSLDRIETELHYNQFRPFHVAWIVMLLGALLSAASLIFRLRWLDLVAILFMLGGFALVSYGLWLRWDIAGRIPASNMYESMLFLSWGTGAFAIVSMLVFRDRTIPLTASAMGAIALLLADTLIRDQFIHPIAPVLLDTYWMSIHVPIIMVSYAVLALAMVIAHVQIITMAFAPHRERIAIAIDRLHYWYVHVGSILLFVGIVTGSMWAASSWGRYWGWDPKEVWSLIAFLAYMTILHVRADAEKPPRWAYCLIAVAGATLVLLMIWRFGPVTPVKLLVYIGSLIAIIIFVLAQGRLATAAKSILAFWMILMTYVGVNYVLGIGLHSYGFGSGSVAGRMLLLGSLDLALLLTCCIAYGIRKKRPSGVPPSPASPG